MKIDARVLEEIIFKRFDNALRFTQDSPVYPDVWLEYFNNAQSIDEYRTDLILTPHRKYTAGELFKEVAERLETDSFKLSNNQRAIASNGETVVARLTLAELMRVVLPLTNWYYKVLTPERQSPEQRWLQTLIGAIFFVANEGSEFEVSKNEENPLAAFRRFLNDKYSNNYKDLVVDLGLSHLDKNLMPLWSVNRNRPANISLEKSVGATKADACRKIFDITGSGISWAVLDTGIDATHPAFRKIDTKTKKHHKVAMGMASDPDSNWTRITATYDFTKFRDVVAEIYRDPQAVDKKLKHTSTKQDKKLDSRTRREYIVEIERDLKNGRVLDWTTLSPLLRIPHNEDEYVVPLHPHGTHVAGILGA